MKNKNIDIVKRKNKNKNIDIWSVLNLIDIFLLKRFLHGIIVSRLSLVISWEDWALLKVYSRCCNNMYPSLMPGPDNGEACVDSWLLCFYYKSIKVNWPVITPRGTLTVLKLWCISVPMYSSSSSSWSVLKIKNKNII